MMINSDTPNLASRYAPVYDKWFSKQMSGFLGDLELYNMTLKLIYTM